jgi:hypothetical protein
MGDLGMRRAKSTLNGRLLFALFLCFVLAYPIARPASTAVQHPSSGSIESQSDNLHIRAAQSYERFRLWKEAENEYLAAGQDPLDTNRQLAAEGILRVRKQMQAAANQSISTYVHAFDSFAGVAFRLLGLLVFVFVLVVMPTAIREEIRRASYLVEIQPFQASGDEKTSEQIAATFSRTRAQVYSVLSANVILSPIAQPQLTPHWHESLPDASLDAGPVKLPSILPFLSLVLRPRYRVIGGAQSTPFRIFLFAEIWERTGTLRLSYKLKSVARRDVPRPLGGEGIEELEIFVYDVFLKTYASL